MIIAIAVTVMCAGITAVAFECAVAGAMLMAQLCWLCGFSSEALETPRPMDK